LLKQAVIIAHTNRQPQQAIPLANLCLNHGDRQTAALHDLATFYLLAGDYERSIETAEMYYARQESLPDQVIAHHLLIQTRLKAGGHWQAQSHCRTLSGSGEKLYWRSGS
jgi:hypothetical protein